MATPQPCLYQLSCEIFGHSADVRAVVVVSGNENDSSLESREGSTLLTASRDGTACVWESDVCSQKDYVLKKVIRSHTGYVSSLCFIPVKASAGRAKFKVATGGQDNTILIHSLEDKVEEPVERYIGHQGLVTCLVYQHNQLISGSWDSTIRVWKAGNKSEVIEAHKPAVWAIAGLFEFDGTKRILSGGADRMVRLWEVDTRMCVQEYHGHADVVRDVKISSCEVFLSASNDCVIRKWNIHSGQCLKEIFGHEAFVYSLALLPNGNEDFVSCGEDGTVRVWKGGECKQVIHLPATSVWCVACSTKGDIVTGSRQRRMSNKKTCLKRKKIFSDIDGVARVFTIDGKKIASAHEISVFAAKVAEHKSTSKKNDIDVSKLPGKDALSTPGHSNGDTLMINNDGVPEVYQWNLDVGEWLKIGNAIGKAPDNSQVYNGKEYDFVFEIELDEGPPPKRTLKLPYNRTTDPYVAAEDFLGTNNLPAHYLDQVAEFIIQNAGSSGGPISAVGADPFTGGSRYVPDSGGPAGNGSSDPFTGGNRYQPDQTSPMMTGSSVGGAADPFTGRGGYRPTEIGQQSNDKPQFTVQFQGSGTSKNIFFPMPDFKFFESPKDYSDKVMSKIREFNGTIDSSHQLSDVQLSRLHGLCEAFVGSSTISVTEESLTSIEQLLNWPGQFIFPGLDILRLALLNKTGHKHFVPSVAAGQVFVKWLLGFMQGPEMSTKNQLLVLRGLANIFSQPLGIEVMDSHRVEVFADLSKLCTSCTSKPNQIALATVVLNYSHHYSKLEKLDGYMECIELICKLFDSSFDAEAKFRALISVGSLALVSQDAVKLSAKPKDIVTLIQQVAAQSNVSKVKECANAVLKSFK